MYIPRIPRPAVSTERTNDVAWLEHIRGGTPLIVLGLGCWMLGEMIGPFMTNYPADSHLNPARTNALPVAVGIAGWIVLVIGAWRLTAPDSVRKYSIWLSLPRWIGRFGLVAGVASQVVQGVLSITILERATHSALSGIALLLGVLGMFGLFALCNYITRLAPIALTVGIKAFSIVVGFGLLVSYGLAKMIPALSRPSGPPTVADFSAGCVMLLAMLATFVFAVLMMVLVNSVRLQLGRTVQEIGDAPAANRQTAYDASMMR